LRRIFSIFDVSVGGIGKTEVGFNFKKCDLVTNFNVLGVSNWRR
jgi:hypothetical protein